MRTCQRTIPAYIPNANPTKSPYANAESHQDTRRKQNNRKCWQKLLATKGLIEFSFRSYRPIAALVSVKREGEEWLWKEGAFSGPQSSSARFESRALTERLLEYSTGQALVVSCHLLD